MTLKDQAINGVLWKSAGTIFSYLSEFIVGIILARILTPAEFGLIGTIMVVIVICRVFVNSGFSQAIVRKQNCTQTDYSTAFFFNLAVGIFLFLTLLVTAGPISNFFNNPELKALIQVLGITLIINSLTIIQQAKLVKRIDFKTQTKITLIASVISGAIAIAMAFSGFGVWSLIAKTLLNYGVTSALLWYYNRWQPDLIFSLESFRELFGFGSKLLVSGLLGTIFNNLNYAVIGKYFSAQDLGFYTRSELFKNLFSQNAEAIMTAVGYPVLAKVQDDPIRLNSAFRQILSSSFYVISILMFGLAAVSHSMIFTLIGPKWEPSVLYLQMMCFVGLLYPLNSLNINLLNVVGRSDLYLKLQLISQIFTIPAIIIGIIYGIKILILGLCLNSLFAYIYFSKVSAKYSGYTLSDQLRDIIIPLLLAALMGILVFIFDYFTDISPMVTFIVQTILGITLVLGFGELFKMKDYQLIKGALIAQYVRHFPGKT